MNIAKTALSAIFVLSVAAFSVAEDRAILVAELDQYFSQSLATPSAFDARVRVECQPYPEGDLTPFTFVATAWCHLIYQNPGTYGSKMPLIENALDLAVQATAKRVGASGGDLRNLESTNQHGGHLARLAMALTAWRLAGGNRAGLVLVEEHLIKLLSIDVGARSGPITSHPGEIFPLDTTIALFAIDLHDRIESTDKASELISSHKKWIIEKGTDASTKLPDFKGGSNQARGSDLSLRLALWSELDREQGQKWYQIYRSKFWAKATVAQGFREWSNGDKTTDFRSGPILAGIGGSSTVLGLPASLSYHDSAASDLIFGQAGKLSKSRKSKDFISRILAKTIDKALVRSGIEPAPGFITGFLYGDAMAFYAASWHDYPDKVVGQ